MLDDGTGDYFDPLTYQRSQDTSVATRSGVSTERRSSTAASTVGLDFENVQDSSSKFTAAEILTVPSTAATYAQFWASTRLEQAKAGILTAVSREPISSVRWGLMKLRQNAAAWRTANTCDKPVRITNNATQSAGPGDSNPCNAGGGFGLGGARFAISAPQVGGSNFERDFVSRHAARRDADGRAQRDEHRRGGDLDQEQDDRAADAGLDGSDSRGPRHQDLPGPPALRWR